MSAPFTLPQAVDLTDVAIQDIYLKESSLQDKSFYDKYFNVVTGVTDYYLKDSSLSGLGNASRITENAVITAEVPVQGYDKTYTQVEFGKMLPVTKRMWKFGIQKRDLTRVVKSLLAACKRQREILCADRLDNSYSTAYTASDDGGNYSVTISGGDTVALISNAHTREDGGTNWNNRITDGTTVNMDMDYDALKALARTGSLVRDPKGNLMDVSYNSVIVRSKTTTHFRAREIQKTIRVPGRGTMPGTADNDAAAIDDFEVIAVPWITTNTLYWWGVDTAMKGDEYGLQYKESQGIMLEGPHVVFKTGEIQYKTTMMFDIGFNDGRCMAGSKNTNASQSVFFSKQIDNSGVECHQLNAAEALLQLKK